MVHFVGAGPGAPDLITRRGAALLADADCIIYAGSLVNPALLGLAKPGCAIYNSAEMTLEQVLDTIRASGLFGGTDGVQHLDVAHFVDIDGTVDAAAHLLVGGDNIGDLQSGKVERLAWRNASHGILLEAFGEGGKRRIVVSLVGQFAMNFICHNKHSVAQTDVSDMPQLFRRPDPSDRIVRIT